MLDEPPAVARSSRLPAYLLLGNVHNLPDGLRQARELLGTGPRRPRGGPAGAAADARRRSSRAGSLGEAAARLGVHRNTVAYRVRRLEALGGWDLSDPDLRFALGVAPRILRQRGTSTQRRRRSRFAASLCTMPKELPWDRY